MRLPDWLKKRRPQNLAQSADRLRILVVSLPLEDRFVLEGMRELQHWELSFCKAPQEAFRLAKEFAFDVILCDRDQAGFPWRAVLDQLVETGVSSCILLVSPVNDDYLWREVVHHGGYDVLTRPLREESVLRAIRTATRFTRGAPC